MIYRFGDCELDLLRYELRRGGRPRHLEPQVFEVLSYLVRNRDRVVTKNELLDQVWGSRFVTESALTSRLKAARRAVGDSGREQRVIRTVHGRGYRFLAPVQEGGQGTPGPAALPAPIGREAELQRLAALLELAAAGRRQVVFVTGESGIGKTTLVEAFAEGAGRRDGLLVARGQCLEHRGTPEPYLPILDALARLCREQGEALVALLSRVAPTWLVQMPALGGADDREDLERRALGGTRERMLREAAEALEAIGSDRPLALVVEDLHWADPSTVDLVQWLARRDTAARLLLVGTYRPADARAAGHPIGEAGADLRLRELAHELRLDALDVPAVRAVLERRLDGTEVPEELARFVHQRTDGVPLFVTQLAQAWTDSGVLRRTGSRWELVRRDADPPDDLWRLIERSWSGWTPTTAACWRRPRTAGSSSRPPPRPPARPRPPRRSSRALPRWPATAASSGPPARSTGRTAPCRRGSRSPTTCTGPCSTTGSRRAGGQGCTPRSPSGSSRRTARPPRST